LDAGIRFAVQIPPVAAFALTGRRGLSRLGKTQLQGEAEMNVPLLRRAAVATLLFSATLSADSLPLQSVNKANEVIDAAIEAHGGAEALNGLKTLTQKSRFTTWATGQSRKPGPPWDRGHTTNVNAIDLENGIFVNRNQGEGGGYVFDNGTIIDGDNSWQIDYRAGTAAPLTEPDFDTQSGPFIRVTPALLLRQLQSRRHTSHWLGEVDVAGRPHDVITLVMETGPGLSLYFDRANHMLTRMERVLPPFGQVEYEFLDYTTIDGIAFNQRFRLYLNGEDNLAIDIDETRVNAALANYLQVPSGLEPVAAITPDAFGSQELDEGVLLIGGNGTYALFVEMADFVVAIGGTQIVPEAIAELQRQIPDKPIRYGVLTHHHSDHVPGAAAYAKEGASIITFAENEAVVRQAADDESAQLQFVDQRLSLGDGKRSVELYDIGPTPHAEHILVAYLPAERILFEADHFPLPLSGVIPPAVPATVAFAKALDRLNLDYRRIVGAHSPRTAGPDDVRAALRHPAAAAAAGM
jgi:glyoxylase-like metal-dependent hydrolase (beta-lactamase superfamily II)